jgi:putative SOS response-associated peptidase YedK
MRWGRVPFWTKGVKVGFANINAMAETVAPSRPSARHFSGAAVWYQSMVFTN